MIISAQPHLNLREIEMNNRAAFIDFCQGLLDMDPIQRWTPQQARLHPFITGEKWTKPWQVSLPYVLMLRDLK